MPKCDFNKVALANLLRIFRTPFSENTPGRLLLTIPLSTLLKMCLGAKGLFWH